MITARVPGSRIEVPLIGRTKAVVEATRELAEAHAAQTNQSLRLAQFALSKVLQ